VMPHRAASDSADHAGSADKSAASTMPTETPSPWNSRRKAGGGLQRMAER